ncbi:MAG TPA: hypothetical protein VF240_14200, partial [Pyrinomonadaceae bacterium]
RIASAVSRTGRVADARFLRVAGAGRAVAAIHDDGAAGGTHLFVLEGRGERFRVTGRSALDADGFRDARWTQEAVDLDSDGYHEVLCTGVLARGTTDARRYVLYSPRTRQTYTLSVAPNTRGARQIKWSPNALTRAAHPFRAALQHRASMALPSRIL